MKILYSCLIFLLLAGCQQEFDAYESPGTGIKGPATLTLNFSSTELEPASSRTLTPSQEQQVKDVNIYLFHKASGTCTRQYISSSTSLSLQLPLGEYDLYAIANYGSDLGDKTKSEVEDFQINISSESALEVNGVLPMSNRQTVNLIANQTLRIELQRIVAKVDVTVDIESSVSSLISLQSISLVNAPKSCRYFGANIPTIGFLTYAKRPCVTGEKMSFYQLESCQGVNAEITDP